jgi:hypothetical protein
MTTFAFVAAIIAALMIGATLGIGIMAIFIVGSRGDGPPAQDSEFDASINEWGYIGERRGSGDL